MNTPPPSRGRKGPASKVVSKKAGKFKERAQGVENELSQYQSDSQQLHNIDISPATPGKAPASPSTVPKIVEHRVKRKHQIQKNGRNSSVPTTTLDGSDPSITVSRPRTAHAQTAAQNVNLTPVRQEYAGPTFHASPAASALPLPRFFSKSVPSFTPPSNIQARLDATSEESDESDSQVVVPADRTASPLDIFFNAHRLEKAGQMSSSTPMTKRPVSDGQQHSLLGKELFMMELDGTSKHEPSPAPVIKQDTALSKDRAEEQRIANTQALKRLLMIQPESPVESPRGTRQPLDISPDPHTSSLPAYMSNDRGHNDCAQTPGSYQSPPQLVNKTRKNSIANGTNERTNANVKAMETNLRRVLKLDV